MKEKISGYEKIISLMPAGWEDKARELGALTRSRKIQTASDLLKLNLLHLTSGGSFGGTSAMLKISEGLELNKNAVYERICKSGKWLKWLCQNFCRNSGFVVDKPNWLADRRICLVDATEEAKRGSLISDYRLHCMLELFTLDTIELNQTKSSQGETLLNFKNIVKGDIVIGDRAYGNIKAMEYALEKDADFCFRFRANAFNLYNENGEKINLPEQICNLAENTSKIENLYYKCNNKLKPVRVCIYRKKPEDYEKSIRHIKRSNNKKMRGQVSETQAFYGQFIIVATSLNADVDKILELYRARWQIELLFKRFKSIFGYDEMPSRKDDSVMAWFYGKLLLAAICEALVNQGRFSPEEPTT